MNTQELSHKYNALSRAIQEHSRNLSSRRRAHGYPEVLRAKVAALQAERDAVAAQIRSAHHGA